MQQRQPSDALPRRRGRHAPGFQRAVQLPGAPDGVREGEDAEGGEADVEGVVGEAQVRAVHDGGVDFGAEGAPGGYGGAVGGDEVGAEVDGGDVDGWVGCDGRVEQALGREDHGAAGVVEDSEAWSGGGRGEGGGDEGDEVVGEDDVATARALAVGLGHVAGEGGAGHMGVVVVVIVVVSAGVWGVERCVWWVFGAWVGLRHAWCLCEASCSGLGSCVVD